MDRLAAPAFIVTEPKLVAHSNATRAALLESSRNEMARIERAVTAPDRSTGDVAKRVPALNCETGS